MNTDAEFIKQMTEVLNMHEVSIGDEAQALHSVSRLLSIVEKQGKIIEVAEKYLKGIAIPALGGKLQQYSAKEALTKIRELKGE